MAATGQRLTQRLRLVPIGQDSAGDLLRLHQDPGIAAWYGGPWTAEQAHVFAVRSGEQWARTGVGKWLAHDLATGGLVGRGGLSLVELLGRLADEVVAFTEVHNTRSRRVMERLGMTYVREIRRPGLVAGVDGVRDDAPFALYRITRPAPRGAP